MNSSCAITLQQAHYRAIDWFYAFQFHALHPRRHRHREATLLARSRKTMRSKCLQSFYPMIMYALPCRYQTTLFVLILAAQAPASPSRMANYPTSVFFAISGLLLSVPITDGDVD
jgi:hypothetical protein